MRSSRILASILVAAVLVTGCGGDIPTAIAPPVASVQLYPDSVLFRIRGSSARLAALAYDSVGRAISGKTFAWSSSDPEVASVDSAGVVTVQGDGEAEILAEVDGVSGGVTVMAFLATFHAVWGSGPDDVWVVGGDGSPVRFHFDGTTWRDDLPRQPPSMQGSSGYRSLWGSGPGDMWIGSGGNSFVHGLSGHFAHYSGAVVGGRRSYRCVAGWPGAVWGSDPADVWAFCEVGGLSHYDGTGWGHLPSGPSYRLTFLTAIWGSGPADVWAVGVDQYNAEGVEPRGMIHHYDGSQWSDVSPGSDISPVMTRGWLRGVWGSGSNDVWVVGTAGTILHYDGQQWTDASAGLTNNSLSGVWGSSPADVWAVGHGGTILHYDGNQWSDASPGLAWDYMYDLWGSGPDDVWAVGFGGTILHYDGTQWNLSGRH